MELLTVGEGLGHLYNQQSFKTSHVSIISFYLQLVFFSVFPEVLAGLLPDTGLESSTY